MWKPNNPPPTPMPAENAWPQSQGSKVENSVAARVTAMPQQNPASIGKSITIKGEITGSEALHIEGRVEGIIRCNGAYLNIGPEASVQAKVEAREIVVRGSVIGNVSVTERIDIRSGGSLVGDVVAHSVSIEEGAYFKGSIDMRRPDQARRQEMPSSTSESARAATASA